MYNKKLIDDIILKDDKIIIEYESGIKRVIKDKYIVEYLRNNGCYVYCINNAIRKRKIYIKNKNRLTFNKFMTILENNNNGFYNSYNYQNGCLYFLSSPLSNELKNKLLKAFNNIDFFSSQCQYAPEIKTDCIFIK